MKHNATMTDFPFVREPVEFTKYTERDMLQYCLGATMYMPGTKNFLEAILTRKYPGLTTMVMCFEDACKEEDVPAAEDNALHLLTELDQAIDAQTIEEKDIPLIVFRVRNLDQFKHFAERLTLKQAKRITAFNFPKFNRENGQGYFEYLRLLNQRFDEIIYGMPILESREMAYLETRQPELIEVRAILEQFRDLVLNIRVGGTDWSSVFGVRRGINYSIYDILPVADCLKDVLNVFTRNNDYCVSGPVWEYFRASKEMKFEQLPVKMNESIFRREPMINDAIDGLLREVLLDRANGFVGKTIIHPTHIPYVNGMYAVTEEVYNDAMQILQASGGVVKSAESNKMNEIGPHRKWAEKIKMRAMAYGVIPNESYYTSLFLGHSVDHRG